MTKKQTAMQLLENYTTAMIELKDHWLDNDNDDMNDLLSNGYPFNQDFIELTSDVVQWAEIVRNSIDQ